MDIRLQIFLISFTVLFLLVILYLLKKKKLNLKYTLLWILTGVVMLVLTIFPDIVTNIAMLIGMAASTNLVFFMEGIFVLAILLSLTVIVSRLSNKVYRLTQTQALLEKRVRDLEAQLLNKTKNHPQA